LDEEKRVKYVDLLTTRSSWFWQRSLSWHISILFTFWML